MSKSQVPHALELQPCKCRDQHSTAEIGCDAGCHDVCTHTIAVLDAEEFLISHVFLFILICQCVRHVTSSLPHDCRVPRRLFVKCLGKNWPKRTV